MVTCVVVAVEQSKASLVKPQHLIAPLLNINGWENTSGNGLHREDLVVVIRHGSISSIASYFSVFIPFLHLKVQINRELFVIRSVD